LLGGSALAHAQYIFRVHDQDTFYARKVFWIEGEKMLDFCTMHHRYDTRIMSPLSNNLMA